MGTVLGKGGFCTVFEVTKVTIADPLHPIALLDATAENFIVQDRNYMAQRYIRQKDGQSTARYALKKLSAEHRKDPERFVAGVIDLALEARFLAILKHPHIIKMRAFSNASPCSDSFFVVLDRLYDTLSDRLQVKHFSSYTSLLNLKIVCTNWVNPNIPISVFDISICIGMEKL